MPPFPSDAWEEGHPDGGGSRSLCVRLADGGGQRANLEGGCTTGSLRMGVSGRGIALGPALRFVEDVLDGQAHGRLEGRRGPLPAAQTVKLLLDSGAFIARARKDDQHHSAANGRLDGTSK